MESRKSSRLWKVVLFVSVVALAAGVFLYMDHRTQPIRTSGRPAPHLKEKAVLSNPYLPVVTNDPWNHPYTYTVDPQTQAVTVRSLGEDGVESADDITFVQ